MLGVAFVLALRYRNGLIWVLVLVALSALQAIAMAAGDRLSPEVLPWIARLSQRDAIVLLSVGLSLVAIAILASLLSRQRKVEQDLSERTAVITAAQRIAGFGSYRLFTGVRRNLRSSARRFSQGLVGHPRLYPDPNDRNQVENAFRTAEDERGSYVVGYRTIQANGNVRHVQEVGGFLEDGAGL